MELKLEKKTARKLFPESPDWFKKVLVETFGEKSFVIDYRNIDSYEDAVEMRPVDEDDIIYPTDRPHIVAYKQYCHIVKAINGNWKADYNDPNQKKWFPVFLSSGSGFGFSYSDSYYDSRFSSVGSRLVFESEAKSDHMGKTFNQLFNNF